MYIPKKQIFNNLTVRQKSSLLHYLKAFVKRNSGDVKSSDLSVNGLIDEFIEDETYFHNLGSPHFEWVIELFEDEDFLKDLKFYITALKKEIEFKESQKPFIEAQKAYLKQQRKIANENKMKSEEATEKQLKYYKNLCKKCKKTLDLNENPSKFELKIKIEEILNESGISEKT